MGAAGNKKNKPKHKHEASYVHEEQESSSMNRANKKHKSNIG